VEKKYFKFFNPIFNVADVAISIGVISILLFQRSFFSNEKTENSEENIVNPDDKVAELETFQSNETDIVNEEKPIEDKNEINSTQSPEKDSLLD